MTACLGPIEVVSSATPTLVIMELDDAELKLALRTGGESLRDRLMLALIESLVFDVPELDSNPAQVAPCTFFTSH
jgi:hypothetical protein